MAKLLRNARGERDENHRRNQVTTGIAVKARAVFSNCFCHSDTFLVRG